MKKYYAIFECPPEEEQYCYYLQDGLQIDGPYDCLETIRNIEGPKGWSKKILEVIE